MSWSVSFIGKPEKVVEALDTYEETLTGLSKDEFAAAKPHLAGLVQQIYAKEGSGFTSALVKVTASGHGTSRNDEMVQSSLSVVIEPQYSVLV